MDDQVVEKESNLKKSWDPAPRASTASLLLTACVKWPKRVTWYKVSQCFHLKSLVVTTHMNVYMRVIVRKHFECSDLVEKSYMSAVCLNVHFAIHYKQGMVVRFQRSKLPEVIYDRIRKYFNLLTKCQEEQHPRATELSRNTMHS